jgi:hypothetical protein
VQTPGGGWSHLTLPLQMQLPLVQTAPSGQRTLQPPQLSGSSAVGKQTMVVPVPGHCVVPIGQVQTLLLQVAFDGQALPQAPQLLLSEVVSTQLAPHRVLPVPHVHTPPTHEAPAAAHALSQPPQLFLLVLRLTHVAGLPHSMNPAPVHWAEHVPPLHEPVHVVVQVPQCWGSPLVSTQPAPGQVVWLTGQPQLPMTQVVPLLHVFPHEPQLVSFAWVSTHRPLQLVWPEAQLPVLAPPAPL